MDDAGIPALIQAIKNMHSHPPRLVEPTWVESVHVHEKTDKGETVWDGEVQVFDLKYHPRATRCYAWSHETEGGRRRFHAVLGLPPVDGPVMAVKTAVLAHYRATS